MQLWLLTPALFQMLAMSVDELHYHRARGLPRWERVGHPLDTLSAAACYAWLVVYSPQAPHALAVYLGLAAFSCLLITKDEFVHAKHCTPGEQWLHAALFVLHPIVFAAFGWLWWISASPVILKLELGLSLAFGLYQVLYWSTSWSRNFDKQSP